MVLKKITNNVLSLPIITLLYLSLLFNYLDEGDSCAQSEVPSEQHSQARGGTDSRVHRRRIRTEEKAKVVAAVWGAEFSQFVAALAILH